MEVASAAQVISWSMLACHKGWFWGGNVGLPLVSHPVKDLIPNHVSGPMGQGVWFFPLEYMKRRFYWCRSESIIVEWKPAFWMEHARMLSKHCNYRSIICVVSFVPYWVKYIYKGFVFWNWLSLINHIIKNEGLFWLLTSVINTKIYRHVLLPDNRSPPHLLNSQLPFSGASYEAWTTSETKFWCRHSHST
jgi:hypothetical protein